MWVRAPEPVNLPNAQAPALAGLRPRGGRVAPAGAPTTPMLVHRDSHARTPAR